MSAGSNVALKRDTMPDFLTISDVLFGYYSLPLINRCFCVVSTMFLMTKLRPYELYDLR